VAQAGFALYSRSASSYAHDVSDENPDATSLKSVAAESSPNFELEIAHVLFMDIVGYSKGLIDEQRDLLNELNKIVRETLQFKSAEAAGKLTRLPTGDGMALAFFTNPEAPLKCAIEISEAVGQAFPPAGEKRGQAGALALHLRMGIHSGPVSSVSDVNDRSNVAGAGINMAQRVMDCGDAGHILLSKRIADDLAQYGRWRPQLHELGEVEVKHGGKIDIVNFYSGGIGNAAVPGKVALRRQEEATASKSEYVRSRRKRRTIAIAFPLAVVLIIALSIFGYRIAQKSAVAIKSSVANLIPEKSIAVLPFENLSAEKENAFFADGIQDDVLTSLTKISDLKVISRTSVMQYRGASAARNLRDIARTLGVENILEGSVRRAGSRVLVSVQLIDASNDRHIWAERYDRTIADSIGLQGELATEIAKALKAKLAPEEKTTLGTKPTNNPEAYVFYLRALELEQNVETPEDLMAVNQLYAQAIAVDPTFALAHARASIIYSGEFWQTHDPALKAKARTLAEEALRLSPALGEAHLALGLFFYLTERNYTAALQQFTVALTALPNNVEVLMNTAGIYRRQGRWREAIAGFEQARSLNPLVEPAELVRTYWMVRDWRATAAAMKQNLARAPDAPHPRVGLAQIEVVAKCDLAASRTQLRQIPAGVDPNGEVTLANWNLSMLERDFATAEKWLADFPSDKFPGASPKSFYQARTALARGDVALARTLFEKVRPALESNVRDHPDAAGDHAALGILYAYMGRKEEAIRESRRAVELCPESTDAIEGVYLAYELALVYALTGETDQALTLIERLVRTPGATTRTAFYDGGITQAELRLRWQWDPLRTNLRFQKILEGPEPKTVY
jgi:TolB-like protein/class 3 adenylate cyclase/Tfp pilus assembly protein PilF